MVDIAQLVSASDCGSEGRGFESHYPPHKKDTLVGVFFYGDHGIRKAVKKTCRGHVFRPWANPSKTHGTPYGVLAVFDHSVLVQLPHGCLFSG